MKEVFIHFKSICQCATDNKGFLIPLQGRRVLHIQASAVCKTCCMRLTSAIDSKKPYGGFLELYLVDFFDLHSIFLCNETIDAN